MSEHELKAQVSIGLVKSCTYVLSILDVESSLIEGNSTKSMDELKNHNVLFRLDSDGNINVFI